MTKHQIIRTAGGEELVILSKSDFDALVAIAAEAEEDAADVAAYDRAMLELDQTEAPALSPVENATLLIRHGLIRSARKRMGMNQATLAVAVGVTQAFISEVESGRKRGTDATMRAIAEALNVPAAQLGVAEA